MKRYLTLLCSISLLISLIFSNTVLATSVYLLTSEEKQDDSATIQKLLNDYNDNGIFDSFKTANSGFTIGGTSYKAEEDKKTPSLSWLSGSVTFNTDSKNRSGSWDLLSTDKTFYFYTLKAGNKNSGGGFELYWIPEGAASGEWSISGLNNHALSHMSFFTLTTPPNTPVPVPASLFLLGSGLVGVFPLARRNRNKKI